MEDLIKTVKIISSKKTKDKGGKKKKEKNEPKKEVKAEKPKQPDKFEERKGLYKQYGDGDIQGPPPEDDYNDDGDFM